MLAVSNHNDKPQYLKAARDFAAVFTSDMLQIMFTSEEDSTEKSVYQSMLVQEYGKLFAPCLKLSDSIIASMLGR